MANLSKFTLLDYIVFGGMLLISSIIGIYFGCAKQKSNDKDNLVADRNVNWFPLFVSFFATYLSAIAITGMSSEVFTYGIQYVNICFSYPLVILVCVVIILPIMYNLKVVSANEYLEKRFSRGVRFLGCLLFLLQYVLYVSLVLYAPSLALESVAKVPLSATIISTGVVCTFYTALGGMKAVIWTDVFQAVMMLAGLFAVCIIGVMEVGGLSKVFEIAAKGERLIFFDFNPDPTVRSTFWTLTIGATFTAIPVWTVSQPAVQRFQAAKSLSDAKKALLMNIPALVFFICLVSLSGLVVYAVYHDCNIGVLGIKAVNSNDQVLPYFIMEKLGKFKGVPGLFTACLFSGALSSASSGINSMAAVVLEDIVKKIKPNISNKASTVVSKTIVCVLGTLVIGLAFLVKYFGSMVMQGAYFGVFIGCSATFWLAIGSFFYPPNKGEAVVHVYKCFEFNITNATMDWQRGSGIIRPSYKEPDLSSSLAAWYSISYLWYAAIGVSFTIVAGSIFSSLFEWIFPTEVKKVDKDLLFNYRAFLNSLTPCCIRKNNWALRNIYLDESVNSIPMNSSSSKLCVDD
ncbi:sodium-coupled monocarboxylate transporter 1 isoform X5 [Hydra vulgaris]|uniref:Sodium-coupled monocarboxylate transporter 1 isoform X5 n=1 Tax=Hydra vulgaris TaxID=6087 RepID=A0ABM4DEI2_HYDVU